MSKFKIYKFAFLIIISAAAVLTACNSNNAYTRNETVIQTDTAGFAAADTQYSAEDVFDSISKSIIFNDTMEIVTDDYSEMLLNIPSSLYSDCILYMGSGATAEELLIFDVSGEDNAEEITELLNTHIEDQKQAFEGYNPDELNKLADPLVMANGNIIICIVCSDSDTAKTSVLNYFNEK